MSNQRIDLSKLGKREWMPLSFNDGNLKNVACFFVKHQWDSERTINGTYAEYQIRGCLRCHRIEVYLGYEGSYDLLATIHIDIINHMQGLYRV